MKALSAASMSLAIVLALAAPGGAQEPVIAGQDNVPVPKKTKTVLPEYPPEAQARGQRGIVIVELVIDTQGKVSAAQVVRSIPPFDEAALTAVRQWEYEVTRVSGKPVSVKLTVPITFAMKIPEIASRQEGIPELRAGAFPPLPADARETATATAEVTLGAEGNVEELRIVDGPPAYADALARALRTWRFAPESSDATVTFQVHAQFNPSAKASKVEFRLDGLRRSETLAADTAAGAPTAGAPTAAPVTSVAPAAPAPPAAVATSPTSGPASAANPPAAVPVPPPSAAPAAPKPASAGPAVAASAPPAVVPAVVTPSEVTPSAVTPPAVTPAHPRSLPPRLFRPRLFRRGLCPPPLRHQPPLRLPATRQPPRPPPQWRDPWPAPNAPQARRIPGRRRRHPKHPKPRRRPRRGPPRWRR